MSASRARIVAVLRMELRTQRREPLTVLYVLVLGMLAAAFAAAGPVELVRNRGAVPRDAAWSMLLAATALTAFGQVITTMVASTVVLRDEHDRVAALLAATRLTRREYLLGKLLAALLLLGLIYASIPIGLTVGAVLAGGSPAAALGASLPPFLLVVLPTMLAVGALQFAAGVLSGRLWVIVAQGLVLIWLWSVCVDAAQSSWLGAAAAFVDPFGSAAVLRGTAAWSDIERVSRPMPITAALLSGRVLWLLIGSVAAFAAVVRSPRRTSGARHTGDESVSVRVSTAQRLQRAARPVVWSGMRATSAYVTRWMLRDAGWRVLATLGALNVGVHAFLDARSHAMPGDVTAVALTALHMHAQLFLILLATIYAGELVWRERDERSASLFDVVPISDTARIAGGVSGVICAQSLLVLALGVTSALGASAGGHALVHLTVYLTSVVHTVLFPFIAWMLLAMAVHVLVQQKVVAHLICIAGWVLAVLSSRIAASPLDSDRLSRWWVVCSVVAVLLSWLGWARGEARTVRGRCHAALHRVGLR